MREILDSKTGAILFKPDVNDPNEMELRRLNDKINNLEEELCVIKGYLTKVMELINISTSKTGQY